MGVALLLVSLPADGLAQERSPHQLRLEGTAAASLEDGNSIGGGFGAGYEYRLLNSLGLVASFNGDLFPDEGAGVPDGTGSYRGLDGRLREIEADGVMYPDTKFRYYGTGGGLRLHALPENTEIDLWLGTGLKYVRIRDESRVGIDVGIGADFSFGGGGFAVGSFVRYTQVFQPAGETPNSGNDDRFVQLGAALSWGGTSMATTRMQPEPEIEPELALQPEPEPKPEPADGDGDGIRDADDQCPAEPEDLDGFEDTDGCPDLDNDADGIPNAMDECRNVAGVSEEQGCPAKPAEPMPLPTRKVELPTRVTFGYGAKAVTARGARNLREVLEIMKNETAIRKLLVVGHADDRGSPEVNLALSRDRAQAVVDWLVANGIEASRLEADGRGANEPRAEGQSKSARRANRRVEFVVTDPTNGQIPTSRKP